MKNIFEKVNFKRIAVFVALITVFFGLIFASYLIQKKYYSRMEDNLINRYFAPVQKLQAQYLATKLSDKTRNIFGILKISAEYGSLQDISADCRLDQKATLEQIAVSLGEGISHLVLIDSKGKVICASAENIEGRDISALPHIQEQLAAKKPVASRLFVNPLGEKLISFTVPIFSSEGKYRGALGAGLNLDFLKQLLSSDFTLVPSGYYALVDDDRTILYYPEESFIGENVFGAKIQEMTDSNQGFNNMMKKMLQGKTDYDFYTFRDNVKVAGYAPITLFDGDRFWTVASTANLKDYAIFTEPFFVKGLLINLFLIFGVFILILLAVYFLRHFTRERERSREEGKGERIKAMLLRVKDIFKK